MKTIAIRVSDELHTELKIHAVKQGRTVSDVVTELIEKDLQKEKE